MIFFSIYNQSLNLRNLKDQHNNGNQSNFHLPSGHVIKCLGVDSCYHDNLNR